MANNRFNKQVSPKGYKIGGRVKKMGGGMMKRPMMEKPMMKEGGEVKQTWITKKEDKTITKKSVNAPKKIEGASKWITKKSKPKKTGPYITKKSKYITKKSPAKIQDRERVR
jgi:hypothetical protein